MILRCKKCNCIITIIDDPYFRACTGRGEYYCQGCGEDKQSYEIYEVEE